MGLARGIRAGPWPLPPISLAHGEPRAKVAFEVQQAIGGREVLSDNPAYEQYWLWVLQGGRYLGYRVGSLAELFVEIAGGDIERIEKAVTIANAEAPKRHRAADDVRHYLVMMRELLWGS